MSWTITRTDENKEDIGRLQTALQEVAKTKLLFCAAPDSGDLSEAQFKEFYPVGCPKMPKEHTFKIGAAKAAGSSWSKTGCK